MNKSFAMIVEIDIQENLNVDIVGWENTQPTQAYALSIEDSGDGEAWLIYGGKHGIRLRSTSSTKKNFSLQNKDEWGEKYLCYHRNV